MKPDSVQKILVITLSNVGDVAVSTPVLIALRKKFPQATLTILVGPKAHGVVASSPDVDRIILYDKKVSWANKWKLALELRREKFDLIVDLRNTAFPFIAGAKWKTNLIRWGEGRDHSMRDRHFKRIRPLGIDSYPDQSFRFFNEKEKSRALEILKSLGISHEAPFFCLAPGARDSKKRWSAEKYGKLARKLLEDYPAQILLLGSPQEKGILDTVEEAAGTRLIQLNQSVSFQEITALLSFSQFYCGNDSGLLHIAHEMKIPSVGIFGPTNPRESGYHDLLSRTAFPLIKDPQDPRGGLDSLSVDRVFENCEAVLQRKDPGSSLLTNIALPPEPKILVSRIDRLGDVVLTTPIFQILKERYPTCSLGVLVSPQTKEIIQGNPYVDKVFIYDKKGKEKSALGTWKYARGLAKKKFDICLNFHATNRVYWLGFLAGIPLRFGHRRKAWRLLTHSIEERKREGRKHESEYNVELLRPLGIQPHRLPPLHFPLKEKDYLSLLEKFPQIKEKPALILSPSASCPSKRWPPERFKTVGRVLSEKTGFQIFLIGAAHDQTISREVLEGLGDVATDTTGKLSLGELAWLLKNSQLLISNDSGPVHIAAALDVPLISLFGRTDPGLSPTRWRPLGEKSIFIYKELEEHEKALDFDYTKPSPRLMKLEAEEVIVEAEKLLSSSTIPSPLGRGQGEG